ncbi:glycosyltransferase [Elizabethkingia anophelis]|uniref:glycosyltransferase n=1 Tax=Elizabethkingia anophelis TaxID=1117645 RepID=UPI000B35940A|nr:glycosyltransferase [Elizabethkingia anophelis]EJC8061655.1 glycosyltransferase [Elizabethkingia anophelis]MCL1642578.1 glycosyltransferase [Elizabethkingia anophelis]MCL1645827.1 glycosyltransferase [Elizabethkingia anophelis]MCT3700313.1 glycosyltransferase [Elizabethkingia anophelis]MCT3898472.1 glycosyltransferase [Elizabethkingia anophelis]
MILIDSIFVNEGGGKALLDYLIESLERTELEVYYLFDKRIESKVPVIKNTNKSFFLEGKLSSRNRFYRQNKDKFSKIFCFGNIPPNIKLNAEVITYFHQPIYLQIPHNLNFLAKLKYKLKIAILKKYKNNTDFWIVQSEVIEQKFSRKFSVINSKVLVLPFYRPVIYEGTIHKEKNSFLYVSNAYPHKNHENLIEAFDLFFQEYKVGKLLLTVSEDYPLVLHLINEKQKKGIPIVNLGYIKQSDLSEVYANSEFLIFPSLAESFGLGLVEAIENKCKIIGADLPYMHAVCTPSLTFDPNNVSSIVNALSLSLQDNLPQSESKISNQIEQFINILQKHANSK